MARRIQCLPTDEEGAIRIAVRSATGSSTSTARTAIHVLERFLAVLACTDQRPRI
jgi:hypothetical protein